MMDSVQDDDRTRCSIVTLVKRGYDMFKQFLIGKPIQSSDGNGNPVAAESDIPATLDESNLLSSTDSQTDILVDVQSGRTNFSSQLIALIDGQENDNELVVISNREIGLIS
ncbi:unnamed protein product [Litomosoides sigmodontis]|uniref:Uncharacterized protein n=1 Tax=Litomosoides sigmodontis TaxID=42156 RepID=A0A3P6UC40_LITSI|nr:unnamed protein product [Litomosoides sigmodontis]